MSKDAVFKEVRDCILTNVARMIKFPDKVPGNPGNDVEKLS